MSTRKAETKAMGNNLKSALEQLRKTEIYDKEAVRDEISDQIHQMMARESVKPAELARRLGKSRAYVTKILQGNANFTIDTIVQIARALGYRYMPLFVPTAQYEAQAEFHLTHRAEARPSAPATLGNNDYVLVELSSEEGEDEESTRRIVG